MTKDEVEKLFEDEKATHDQFSVSGTPCNACNKNYTQMILTTRYRELFNSLIYILNNGFTEWAPFDTTVKTKTGLKYVPYKEGITFLREAFCSKECFINYIYDHQTDIVELITQ